MKEVRAKKRKLIGKDGNCSILVPVQPRSIGAGSVVRDKADDAPGSEEQYGDGLDAGEGTSGSVDMGKEVDPVVIG